MTLGPVLAIANRGEIAARIARTAQALGWQPVALLGDPDLDGYAAREIGRVERIGPAGSELDPALVVAAAERAGAVALHPGYGFLSERADLSQACENAGIAFVGPSPLTLAICGDKVATRDAAMAAGVPVLAASEPMSIDDRGRWEAAASEVGFPLIAKVVSGGGGRGLRVALTHEHVEAAIESALREAGASAAGTRFYLERYLEGARHVEVQVAGNGSDAVAIGDRDCTVQRRHQKVFEEAPAHDLPDETRAAIHRHAVAMTRAVELRGVATVEFLLGADGTLAFIEVNPRLQVEHTVTEEVTGLDLVAIQLGLLANDNLPSPVTPRGHAIQARLYAEDPTHGFVPSPGQITWLDWPILPGLRIDSGYETGDSVPSYYDSLVAKLISHGPDRDAALVRLAEAIDRSRIAGIYTNRPWLRAMLDDERFRSATHDLQTADSVTVSETAPDDGVIAAAGRALLAAAESEAGPFRLVGQATQIVHGNEAGGWQRRIVWSRAGNSWRPLVGTNGACSDPDPRTATAAGTLVIAAEGGYEATSARGRWLVWPGPIIRAEERGAISDGILRAPMPGTVVSVPARPAMAVHEGDVLATMVAMKIEITLAAPFDGIVERVACEPGDLVGSKQALVTIRKP